MSETNRETTRTTADRNERGSDTAKWLSGIASLIGLWIAISPYVYDTTEAIEWNNLLVGAAIFLVAGYNFYRITKNYTTSAGAMSLVALLGLWTLLSPFVMDVGSDALLWSNVVSGLASAALAAYVAYEGRTVRSGAPAGTR